MQKPFLNLGCGTITLPRPRPDHHVLVDEALYNFPLWHNVDRNKTPGVDQQFDVFTYPWPLEDNAYDGALLAHICEHIPHEIRVTNGDDRSRYLRGLQDGWYAFWSELYRVLTPGAVVHILSPYAFTSGAMTDPTHTRYLTEHTFQHSMHPEEHNSFEYANGGINFRPCAPVVYRLLPHTLWMAEYPDVFANALATQINVVYDFYVKLEAVKDDRPTD